MEKNYCTKCGKQLEKVSERNFFDMYTGEKNTIFYFKCPNAGLFSWLVETHTTISTNKEGKPLIWTF